MVAAPVEGSRVKGQDELKPAATKREMTEQVST